MTKLDRSNISRALAKAIAYKECGKDAEARQWAIQLMRELRQRDILRADIGE
jgi:hypothetical protein